MVTPSPGPSRGPTPTSSTHASASSSRASNASKLNPNSATFSYLQQHEPVPSRASPPLHPGQAMPYNTPFPAPPPPSRNGMYGMPMPVGYSPYPISSATTMSGVGPSAAQAAAPSGSWSAPRVGGWPGPSTYGPGPIHHSGPHHHSQPPYYTQSQLPPPAQNRMTPPVPPPSANGILLPLSNGPPPHLAATMAAAGYPHPMPNSPMPPNLPLQTVPHPGLLPPFSPPRPLPPSAAPAPRLVPAPSLPVSPATPLPPQSVPPPPSRTSTSATNPTMPDNLAPAFGAALSPPPPAAAATRSAHGPRGYGIRRKKDHLPAPKDAKPLDFAPNLRMPGGFAGIFRTPSSLGSPGSASGRSRTVTAPSEQKPSAATASAPVTLPTGSPAARDSGESAALASKDAHRPSVLGQAAKLATNGETGESPVPPLSPTRSREQSAAPPLSPTPSGGPSASTPLSPVATSTASHTTSPRTAPSSIKRSWADLVRPAAGSQPAKGVNGVQPISASIGPDPSATLQAGDTLLSTVHRAPPHEHMPHAPTPRGLINNGNLCFANSTLQALVYCGSFWNLMNIVERGTKKNLRDEMTGVAAAEKNASERSAVEATIAFLAEFRTDETPAPAFDPSVNRKSAASASTSGTTTPKPPFNNSAHHHMPSSPSMSTPTTPGPLSPTPIHDALRHNPRFDAMRRGTQEDAEEFLGFFLETLHEEILKLVEIEEAQEEKRKGKGKAPIGVAEEGWEEVGSKGRVATTRTTATKESPITRIFGGKLRSVLRCPGQKDSVTIEPFQRLQLDIQPDHVLSIEDALLHLTTPESLPDFMSSRGVRTQDASKQVFVDALPPVLLLHLKRFLYDEVGGVQKSTKKVAYGTELTIDERVMSAPLRAQVGKDGAKYELFGVVYHHGLQASGGHYTVAVRRGYQSPAWLELDDTHMRSLTEAEVAVSPTAPSRRWESVSDGRRRFEDDDADQKVAYLLLYAKVKQ
ncbi:hypothetical protein C6P46_000809 [Rhodotorula mucilaginosa]|uniref:Ubiquitin carboxyl-terminal hydrolase n=1 Tax=Rhodotorula mucilaginosa TaxID=5537 RepID=A0A9P6VUS0_RHOMI|nr:hypothetical protein C6P46_000809 [Rhodotorula mucilaginosa]